MADQDTPSLAVPIRVVPVDTDGVRRQGISTSVADGRQVVTNAGTRAQFAALVGRSFAITAETDNTGVIVVGGSTVVAALATRQGTPLLAGDTMIVSVGNMNLLYMDSTVSGDGVTWVALA